MEKDISFLRGKMVAHRGLHDDNNKIPENSISAFREAIKKGFAIEFDVHILKDDTLVVIHDDDLKRICNESIKVKDLNYADLKDKRLFGTNEHIPTFDEVIKLVNGKVPLVIEIKTDVRGNKIIDLVMEKLKSYKGKYVIESFDPLKVFYLKNRYPEVIRGQLSGSFSTTKMPKIEKYILRNLFFNFYTNPDFVAYELQALPNKELDKFAKEKDVFIWTIKSKEEYIEAKEYGSVYICENIDDILNSPEITLKGGTILINKETKKIGLVYRIKREDYSFPKGHLEKGETIEECAIRETEEETGRTCKLVDNTPIDILKYSTPRGENVENYMYLAIDTGKSERDILEKDKERVVWVKPKDVEKTLTYTDLKELWNKVKDRVEKIIEEK